MNSHSAQHTFFCLYPDARKVKMIVNTEFVMLKMLLQKRVRGASLTGWYYTGWVVSTATSYLESA